MLARLFRRDTHLPHAHGLYVAAVEQARQPVFYDLYGVPDTIDGRFEMIALHVHLLLRRLKSEGEATRELSQRLFDLMFQDMDRCLREMGVGDLGVGVRIKHMAKSFYGRIAAYDDGLAVPDPTAAADIAPESLSAALRRNVYGTIDDAALDADWPLALARYHRQADALLTALPTAALIPGLQPVWPDAAACRDV